MRSVSPPFAHCERPGRLLDARQTAQGAVVVEDPYSRRATHEFESQEETDVHFRGPRGRGRAFAGQRPCGYVQPTRGGGPHRCEPEERVAHCRALTGNAEWGSRLPDVADVG